MAPYSFHGQYVFSNSDLFSGELNIHGKPAGKGVMYNFKTGECDVGTFEGATLTGTGVRFSLDRDSAKETSGKELSLEDALKKAGLTALPAKRHAGIMPQPTGYNSIRHKRAEAWYQYRTLMDKPMNESPYGENPYPAKYTADEE